MDSVLCQPPKKAAESGRGITSRGKDMREGRPGDWCLECVPECHLKK